MKYSEKFKDPRWQKKRLEILERDDWCCRRCYDTESTLHIHHRWYEKNKDPWDYPNECLVTLCEDCHEEETTEMPKVCESLVFALKRNFFSGDILDIAIGFRYMEIVSLPEVQASAIHWLLESPERIRELSEKYHKHLANKLHGGGKCQDILHCSSRS